MQEIKFNKNFNSPVLGHVYIGKIVTLKPKDAEKYLQGGMAELVESKNPVKQVKAEDNGDSKPKRSKKSSKGRSK